MRESSEGDSEIQETAGGGLRTMSPEQTIRANDCTRAEDHGEMVQAS